MRRVLLTGASGFIGRTTLAPLVERGFEVHAVDLRAPAVRHGVVAHEVDLLDAARVTALVEAVAPTHLLHLAWFATHRLFWTSTENLRWVAASLELVRAFRDAGGVRAVVAGSCAEYDWRHGWCSEAVTPLVPGNLYGTSKDALRRVLEAYAGTSGLSFAWGRVFFLHGPGEHPDRLVASVARSLLRGEPTRCTHGRQVRDFLHVEDVGGGLAALLDAPSVEGAVNVASGEARSLRDVVTALASSAGRADLARFGDIEAAPEEPPLLVADVRRLRDEVGFTPRWGFERGLEDSLASWRGHQEPSP